MTTIGVHQWEKNIQQSLILDLILQADFRQAGQSDQLEDTLDYDKLTTRICDFLAVGHFQLIEAVAEKIATFILQEFSVQSVTVTVKKPGAIRHAKNVGITITRTQLT